MSLCVFCGSCTGTDPRHAALARTVGTILAREKIRLIFGGGSVGLMGILADAVLAGGGEAIGVIPHTLFIHESAHRGLTQLIEVDSMHTRKQQMYALADAFLVIPGGIGTLDELFEIWTWSQLRVHTKPIGLLNTHGFYDHLLAHLDRLVAEDFLSAASRAQLQVGTDPEKLIAQLR